MMREIHARKIPLALLNGRLSPRSFKRWKLLPSLAKGTLRAFGLLLVQTDTDKRHYEHFTSAPVIATDNLKYGASPLPFAEDEAQRLQAALTNRPTWVFASTHNGEETLAAEIHTQLKSKIPNLLSIIVPRHPERRSEIASQLATFTDLKVTFRGESKTLPEADTDIYVADTMGELGLFYHASNIAVIGRSFSLDGGGGHNPLEAAKLGCAVLSGPNMQNLQDIFDDMAAYKAVFIAPTPAALTAELQTYLSDKDALHTACTRSAEYVAAKDLILPLVISHLSAFLQEKAGWPL